MPKNKVSDPITDREIAFARLVLSGTMTDRDAALAAGLNPQSAAYIKSKPRVRAYMAEHRLAVQENLVEQECEGLRKLNLGRDKIIERLWELGRLSPAATRDTITGQLRALAMIAALGGFLSDASGSQPHTTPAPVPAGQASLEPEIYSAAWLRKQGEPEFKPACEKQNDTSADTDLARAASPGALAATPAADGFRSMGKAGISGKRSLLEPEPDSVPRPLPDLPPDGIISPVPAPPGLANRLGGPQRMRWGPDAKTEMIFGK